MHTSRNPHGIVMTDEVFDGADVIGEFLGEREHVAHQTGNTLG
jgi:hypothetical protein